MEIKSYEFSEKGRSEVKNEIMGQDWPVVYLINNDKSIYIGETTNIYVRFGQHLVGKRKNKLKTMRVIFDDEFNKSATLDIEQTLIRIYSADKKFNLLNGNAGQSSKHNYYQREMYINKMQDTAERKGIWGRLTDLGLTSQSYNDIVNSDLFTYSPYTALTAEQEDVAYNILNDMIDGLYANKKGGTTCIVKGAAGTGKTLLAVYLMQILANANARHADSYKKDVDDERSDLKLEVLHKLKRYIEEFGSLSIGYVLPMTSIRRTLKSVFIKTKNGLTGDLVKGPTDIIDSYYDILLVDETHRMPKGKSISWLGTYNDACKKLHLDPESTNTLDWVMSQSACRVLFYDSDQSIKAADITPDEFNKSISGSNKIIEYKLETQMRCRGGSSYVEYLNLIFDCQLPVANKIDKYSIKIFDDANKMISAIKTLNRKYGLCRTVAGYSWKWNTKGKNQDEIKSEGLYDIDFDRQKYCWNMSNREWILRPNSVDEIGCVHTVQGYDLNYVGVIFGKEIDYDPENNELVIYPQNFYDINVKKGVSYEQLKQYILNAYKIMMERGINGCYIYACNQNLHNYLKRCFIEQEEGEQ